MDRALSFLHSFCSPKWSVIQRKTGDYFAACMDEKQIEADGLKPVQPELARIVAIMSRKRVRCRSRPFASNSLLAIVCGLPKRLSAATMSRPFLVVKDRPIRNAQQPVRRHPTKA